MSKVKLYISRHLKSILVIIVIFLVGSSMWAINPPILKKPPLEVLEPPSPPSNAEHFQIKVMTVNIGNGDPRCFQHYNWGLCFKEVEQNIATNIHKLKPDIIAFQELTTPANCLSWQEENPNKVCYQLQEQSSILQVRRILGEDYTIACEPRHQHDCIGVRKELGFIQGCPLGGYCDDLGLYDQQPDKCNDMFTVSAFDINVHGYPIRVINAHPSPRQKTCRINALTQIFEGTAEREPFANGERNLIMGDFNMDPFRSSDASVKIWEKYVGLPGSALPFHYHSGPAEHWPPYDTFVYGPIRRVLDFVTSDFAQGTCQVLGMSPDTERIDGGKGMDHKAFYCSLSFAVIP